MTNFDLNSLSRFVSLSQKMVSTTLIKNCKKLNISLFRCSEYSFLISRSLQNHFLKNFLWPILTNFDKRFLLRYSKICKNLKNDLFRCSEYSFQTIFPKSSPWPNGLRHFASLSQKMVSTSSITNLKKTKNMLFSNAQNAGSWTQRSFKTIF